MKKTSIKDFTFGGVKIKNVPCMEYGDYQAEIGFSGKVLDRLLSILLENEMVKEPLTEIEFTYE